MEFLDENLEEVTIASVVVPTKVEEPEIEEETELIGEDGEPIEVPEGEEGEEPAEGEGGEDAGDDSGGDDSGDE